MTLEIYQNIWFFLIGILLTGYSILDGFDLGTGILFPFLARNGKERESILRTIWPFWDGNEVWLLTGGGALFAAFPHAYATVFSGFYIPLMLVLFALIFRAVSIEFWYYDINRRKLWKWTFFTGSFIPSLLYGVALGNVIVGIPLDDRMNYTGTFLSLLNPFALLCGMTGLAAIILHGSIYTSLKNEGEIRARAVFITKIVSPALIVLTVVSGIVSSIYIGTRAVHTSGWIAACALIISCIMILLDSARGRFGRAFILSSLVFVLLWIIAGVLNYPYLVSPAAGTNTGVSIYNGSSGELTLRTMLIIAGIGMPVVIGYTIVIYRIFRGNKQGMYSHN